MRIKEIFEGLGISRATLDKHAPKVAQHQSAIEHETEQALSIPLNQLTLRARQELGQDESTELELLKIEAEQARLRQISTQQSLARRLKAEQDAQRRFERMLARELQKND